MQSSRPPFTWAKPTVASGWVLIAALHWAGVDAGSVSTAKSERSKPAPVKESAVALPVGLECTSSSCASPWARRPRRTPRCCCRTPQGAGTTPNQRRRAHVEHMIRGSVRAVGSVSGGDGMLGRRRKKYPEVDLEAVIVKARAVPADDLDRWWTLEPVPDADPRCVFDAAAGLYATGDGESMTLAGQFLSLISLDTPQFRTPRCSPQRCTRTAKCARRR
jgi:hypothetical protein